MAASSTVSTGQVITAAQMNNVRTDALTHHGAAYLVASDDAPQRVKDAADYVCDGTADDVQIQAAIDALGTRGGTVQLSEGDFNLTTQIYIDESGKRTHLTGYGSRLITSGGIWAITLETVGAPIAPNTISGITIYQQGDANALGGIRMLGAPNTFIRDVTVVADGDCSSYVACILGARDTPNDGPYWSTIQNVWIRKDAGGNGNIPVGIYLRDNANAIRIIGGGINHCDDAILCDGDEEAGIDLDSLTVMGMTFEGCTDAIELNGATDTNGGSGIKIIGCRGESLTNFLHVNGRGTTGYVEAPQLIGNWASASVTNYVTFTGTTGSGQDYISIDPQAGETAIYTNGSRALTIDSSGNVGIGIQAPDGQFHVWKATAGSVTANSNADGIVLEGSGNEGISILSGSSSHGAVYFGDAADNNVGMVIYDHSANEFTFYANAALQMTLSDGRLAMGDDVLIARDVNAGLTASTTQSQGQGALTAEINEISTCATTNDTVTLPTAAAGLQVTVINNGAETAQIFPASGDDLGAGVNTATTLAAGSVIRYVAYDATNWVAV